MPPYILIDDREKHKEYITAKIVEHGGISTSVSRLSHGIDYVIMGDSDSVGVQRKSGSAEIPQQMQDLRDDILPALKELTDHPVLLIEEDFVIGHNGVFYQRRDSMLYPTDMNTKSYFNFIHYVKEMGVDVVTTRNLDSSIWWMISTAGYVNNNHYPKRKKQFGRSMQAVGALCCINGIGQSKAEKLLAQYSLQELFAMDTLSLSKLLNKNQLISFEETRRVKY